MQKGLVDNILITQVLILYNSCIYPRIIGSRIIEIIDSQLVPEVVDAISGRILPVLETVIHIKNGEAVLHLTAAVLQHSLLDIYAVVLSEEHSLRNNDHGWFLFLDELVDPVFHRVCIDIGSVIAH